MYLIQYHSQSNKPNVKLDFVDKIKLDPDPDSENMRVDYDQCGLDFLGHA